MKGRVVALDRLGGRAAAALVIDGRLADFLLDPPAGAPPAPGAIYRAITERPLKGQGAMLLRLPGGQSGFLRQTRTLAPGRPLLVQVTSYVEAGKAVPASQRLTLKSRYAIATPGAPGINIARTIRVEGERDRLLEIAHDAAADSPIGLIVRSAAEGVEAGALSADVMAVLALAARVIGDGEGRTPELLVDAPDAHALAWRDWSAPAPDAVIKRDGVFSELGIDAMIASLGAADVALRGGAMMFVEPTRALIAIDVNTGPDTSPAAGLKANLAAARELPRQLRLRGLGGQVVLDLAPMPKQDRRQFEHVLKAAFRSDPVETALVGWTTLGHYELQRKRERLPFADLPAVISGLA